MSIEAITAVLQHSHAKGSARLVLVSLAWHANGDGVAWPSQATLAKHARINRRNVRKALAALLALGEIVPVGTAKRGVVSYRIMPGSDRQHRSQETYDPRSRETYEPLIEPSESSSTGEQAVCLWNELADELGLVRVQRLTPSRRSALHARLAEAGGVDGWRAALDVVRATPFLRGENGALRLSDDTGDLTARKIEQILRRGGCSKQQARSIIRHGFKSATQDAGPDTKALAAKLRAAAEVLRSSR